MTFTYQSLLAIGLPIIALPLLIHLINLRRHKRIEWAAMDFLLESQQRNKKWILLKQLLLLLMRTFGIALAVMMLAGPVLQYQWGRLLGSGSTHHLVLLDDSYSMSDQSEQSQIFDEAKRVVNHILQESATRAEDQKLTLLKFSEALKLSAGANLEVGAHALDNKFADEVRANLNKLQPSETDAGPLDAIQAALGLPESQEGETRIVYLVSDFRSQQWQDVQAIHQALDELRSQSDQLQLIHCVDQLRTNLAITRLEPISGIRAAGVESWFQIAIANYGDTPAISVLASVTQNGFKLPAVKFEEIPPGKEVFRRFRVAFPQAGAHQIQASLESDAVDIDNVRYFACQVPASFPVLLVDGSPAGDDGFYLSKALSPGGISKPGWAPQIERPSYLRNHNQFQNFAAICLLDIPSLDENEIAALEKYVEQGGGLGIFLGPNAQRNFYNERLYRDGLGMLPAPIDVPTQLLSDGD